VKKMLDELKGEVARKKTVSREVKDLRATIAANEAEAAQLAAQQQHLKRQIASLQERLQRLEAQVT
jgi:ubiquinone biosynthesis protein UbiJ